MSSAVPQTLDIVVKYWSILCSNMFPAGQGPNGHLMYLYFPNWWAKIVKCENSFFFWSLRLWWQPDLVSTNIKYHVCVSLRNVSLTVKPLCTDLMSACFSSTGSRQSSREPLSSGTCTNLLHHSDVLSDPRGTIFVTVVGYSRSSSSACDSAYDMCLFST